MKMAKKKANGDMTVSLSELSQEIDLGSYLDRAPTDKEKKKFSIMAIDLIDNRTLDGKDINGRKFKKYTEEYAELKGVTRNSVDMFLDGDMLDSMKRKKKKESTDTVFLHLNKKLEIKKGFNHMTRKTKVNRNPKREFFGITDDEAKKITSAIRDDREDRRNSEKSVTLADLRAALDLLGIEQVE